MSQFDFEQLLEDARKVVEKSPTPERRRHNEAIWNKLWDVLEPFFRCQEDEKAQFVSEDEVHRTLVADFDLFCAAYVRLDNWLPMFLAPWQSKVFKIIENHEENLFITCRKVGKSSFETAYMLWRCLSRQGELLVFVAPTEEQLYAWKDAVKAVDKVPFLKDYYIGKDKDGGRRSIEGMVFSRTWSEIHPMCLAQKQLGRTKRGVKAGTLIIDEIQNVLKTIRETVLDDTMSDTYTEKKMVMFGTPVDVANPGLEIEWEDAKEDPEIGTFHMDIWDGVLEGCISQKWVKKRFKKLGIQCPWGRNQGICGKRWKKGKYPRRQGSKWSGWECDECCMLNEVFVAENMGEFPKFAGKYFPKPQIELSAPEAYDITVPNPEEGHKYVMGIDYGAGINPTQITVWDCVDDGLVLNHWREVQPIEAAQRETHRNFDPIIRRIKDIYKLYGRGVANQIKRIYADATTTGQHVTHDLTKDPDAIPLEKIYSNQKGKDKSGKEKKNWIGVWQSGEYKAKEMDNYRRQLLNGKIKITKQEPFYAKFVFEHTNVIVARVESQNYLKFKEPAGGSIDLVDSCALAALELSDEVKGLGAYLGFVFVPAEKQERHERPHKKSEDVPLVVIR